MFQLVGMPQDGHRAAAIVNIIRAVHLQRVVALVGRVKQVSVAGDKLDFAAGLVKQHLAFKLLQLCL